jgi:GxxExxY protein
MKSKKQLDELTYEIKGCAIEVQKEMGRGLLESVYQQCMIEELKLRRISFETEMCLPVLYKGKKLDIDFRCDLYVEDSIVVELKAVQKMNEICEAQVINYMKLLKCPKGILLNFNCSNIFKEGQKTYVNEYFSVLPSM